MEPASSAALTHGVLTKIHPEVAASKTVVQNVPML